MIDHAPRIRAEQLARQDEAYIADLERRAAPLQWAVIAAAIAICLVLAVDGLHGHIQRVTELAAQEEALVQCLNGRLLQLGGTFVQCEVRDIQLVGMQP